MMGRRDGRKGSAAVQAPRLYVDHPLGRGGVIPLDSGQGHYLRNVMRLGDGDGIRLFNGRDGEWHATISAQSRKQTSAECTTCSRAQSGAGDLHYLFAPLKHARLDYMVQKATEMGASVLRPVITERTNVARVNLDRMHANAVEAAEQCNLMGIPDIRDADRLENVIADWSPERRLVYCDETAEIVSPLDALAALGRGPIAVLIGPEGGFSPAECERLRAMPEVCAVSLGPRIMRADTAAVAALALVQAVLGDWQESPKR